MGVGELGASEKSRGREGVPAAEGVVGKKRGCAGGALGMDCSECVLSCISASGGSELGKLRGEDILEVEDDSHKQLESGLVSQSLCDIRVRDTYIGPY